MEMENKGRTVMVIVLFIDQAAGQEVQLLKYNYQDIIKSRLDIKLRSKI